MIFVTVGMHYQGFDRLLRAMDDVCQRIDEDVIMQIGSSDHKPMKAEFFDFAGDDVIRRLCNEARIIVTHCGAGSIITAHGLSKPLVIVPRLRRYGECADDQQLELAEELSCREDVKVVYDVEDLEAALMASGAYKREGQTRIGSGHARLIDFLRDYVGRLGK